MRTTVSRACSLNNAMRIEFCPVKRSRTNEEKSKRPIAKPQDINAQIAIEVFGKLVELVYKPLQPGALISSRFNALLLGRWTIYLHLLYAYCESFLSQFG